MTLGVRSNSQREFHTTASSRSARTRREGHFVTRPQVSGRVPLTFIVEIVVLLTDAPLMGGYHP